MIKEIAPHHAEQVVFEASIRRQAKTTLSGIEARLGNNVRRLIRPFYAHNADEVIFDAAADAGAFVLSSNTFGEFPDIFVE
ncbi:hypothetical protein DID96_34530 [Burkholderia sp. Bp8963]|uniref:hypothetical protein n=1 Tax=Burkholderia sp. Bp8963 TaxID=2184547 RepID=UPI000F5ABC87|nr:hypothetical protein [Burkholderia sp. Bp8963]RQS60665.1 hypothetical protein DID96_34530 [Burkholderia sp. Bp8963]